MIIIVGFLLISFIITFLFTPILIKKLVQKGIVGKDMHKPGMPYIADTGGLAIIFGVVVAILMAIAYNTFFSWNINVVALMAGTMTLLIIEIIGFYDDLFKIPQAIKALLPILAAIPLMVIAAGTTEMSIPFIGPVNFGIYYALLMIPLGITVASNLTNMLAGFNGMETGMGIIIFAVMSILFLRHGETEALVISVSMLGALAAFIIYNWYPANIFPGDATTFLIGGALATVVILGNSEAAGAILMIPFIIDFFIKAVNRFPSKAWWGKYINSKLYCPEHGPVGLCQLMLKKFNGLTEVQLTTLFIMVEGVFGIIVLFLYI
jgi:UDP-N-acetylglucosamine--dolichyl-phosphate N-acetylglucosaminephosphotransferase